MAQLSATGLTVLQARNLTCGDAGLALGQEWVAKEQLVNRGNKAWISEFVS